MRTLWNAVSFLAVVHLLALLLFVGWLWQTDRLDRDRVEMLRSVLARTITEEAAAAAEAAEAEAAFEARRRAEEARRDPALPSSAQVRLLTRAQQEDERARRRLDDVRDQLLRQITIAEARVEDERDALAAQRRSFEGGIDADRRQRSQQQLEKAVKLLESLPPKQAKQKIEELVGSGKMDEAVTYLDAMNQRNAGKILAEFKTDQENKLATELLERIRMRGLRDAADGAVPDAPDADSVADARP